MRIGIDGRYIQEHFPGTGRCTYNLVAHLPRVAPEGAFFLIYNPTLRNTRYDSEGLTRLFACFKLAVPFIGVRCSEKGVTFLP